MKQHSPPFDPVQCARILLALLQHAAVVLSRGYCVGELRACDVVAEICATGASAAEPRTAGHPATGHHTAEHRATEARVWRSPARLRDLMRHRRAVRRHRRLGHDSGCRVFGVPIATLQRLVESWGGEDTAAFLLGIVEETVDQVSLGGWDDLPAHAVLKYEIGRRLTL